MAQDKLEAHFRRCGSLMQSVNALLACASDLEDQGDGTSQALVACIFLMVELANEIEHLEQVVLWTGALSQEKPQAND